MRKQRYEKFIVYCIFFVSIQIKHKLPKKIISNKKPQTQHIISIVHLMLNEADLLRMLF